MTNSNDDFARTMTSDDATLSCTESSAILRFAHVLHSG